MTRVTHGKPGCSLAWLVRRGTAAGKTQRCLRTKQVAILRCLKTDMGFYAAQPRPQPCRPFDPKINVFTGFIVDHFYVKFGDPCIFEISCRKHRQTDKRR